jgi:hypothetical protein
LGDLASLEILLPKRAELLAQITALPATAERDLALRKSRHAATVAIRQVCLTRNLITQEMSQLTQEQRWRDSTSNQPEHSSQWSLQG